MRLPADAARRLFALGLTTLALAGCSIVGGGEKPTALSLSASATGPGADYPMVLGEPFTVEGQLYTPADTLNYDVVGHAGLDGGAGVTLAHRTLPLPSYAEVTSLATGKTILARVERRGPMAGAQFVALSAAAAAHLGAEEGTPVRVRRVNPLEKDRAELRAGRPAANRMETPKPLVEVLRRKLPASGWASLRSRVPAKPEAESPAPAAVAVATQTEAPPAVAAVPAANPVAVDAYPLKPLTVSRAPAQPKPVVVARTEPVRVSFSLPTAAKEAMAIARSAAAKPSPAASLARGDGFVVQAAAFASRANALRAAEALGGFVSSSGKYFRVRTGPFASRGQAEAALAKVRAAGYSDARVTTAG